MLEKWIQHRSLILPVVQLKLLGISRPMRAFRKMLNISTTFILILPAADFFSYFIPHLRYIIVTIYFHLDDYTDLMIWNCFNCISTNHPLKGVPQVPRNVKITEGRRKRTIYIEWTPGDYLLDEDENTVIYLIEERHQTGRYFQEKRFTDWSACSRTDKIVQILRNFAKPGRWYQFRVAAVNANGTKGFSEHSTTFILSASKWISNLQARKGVLKIILAPKPPKAPQNVTVSPVWISNDVLKAELRWTAPVSDLPLQRYRVFWSRRLHGAKALDSVLVHQQVVPKVRKTDLFSLCSSIFYN